jgi:hypothetical protein
MKMFTKCVAVASCGMALVAVLSLGSLAQQQKGDSKSTLRIADGHPDLNGAWHQTSGPPATLFRVLNGNLAQFQKVGDSIIFKGKPGDPPPIHAPEVDWVANAPNYKPEMLAKIKDLDEHQITMDPAFNCGPPGLPRIGPPQHIVQSPTEIAFFYYDLSGNFYRIIPVDQPHHSDAEPSYFGDSVAHWDGDTLVVDAVNFNDDTWLGDNGLFHSTALHVIERLRREGNTLHYDVTVEDPKVLAKPWVMDARTMAPTTKRDEDLTVADAAPCKELDGSHITTLEHHTNVR